VFKLLVGVVFLFSFPNVGLRPPYCLYGKATDPDSFRICCSMSEQTVYGFFQVLKK